MLVVYMYGDGKRAFTIISETATWIGSLKQRITSNGNHTLILGSIGDNYLMVSVACNSDCAMMGWVAILDPS